MKIKLVLSALLIIAASQATAQLSDQQEMLIKRVDFTNHKFDARHPVFMKVGSNMIIRYNPVSLTFSGLLYFYQKGISPQLQSNCPYEVSCSAFSMASIQAFGLVKGVALTADRLTRCTQFTMIDLLPSQVNEKTGKISDSLEKYGRVKHEHR